jgi:hypothetical protein
MDFIAKAEALAYLEAKAKAAFEEFSAACEPDCGHGVFQR